LGLLKDWQIIESKNPVLWSQRSNKVFALVSGYGSDSSSWLRILLLDPEPKLKLYENQSQNFMKRAGREENSFVSTTLEE
jgi:hypothetical protein